MSDAKTPRAFHGRKTLSGWLHYPLKKVQQKRGFAESRLLTDWAQIVGPTLSHFCAPQKLSFPKDQQGATLHVLCEAGWATELQFQQEVLCEKIATFFGYRAVGAIRIHQGVLPPRATTPVATVPHNLDNASETLKSAVSNVQDDALKDALLRLGLTLEAKQNSAIKSETT